MLYNTKVEANRTPHALKTERFRFLLCRILKYASISALLHFKNTKFFDFKVGEFLPANLFRQRNVRLPVRMTPTGNKRKAAVPKAASETARCSTLASLNKAEENLRSSSAFSEHFDYYFSSL